MDLCQYQMEINKTELDQHSPRLSLDSETRTVQLDGKPLKLTRKEFDLLCALTQHAGEVVPRRALLTLVWGYSPGARTRTLDVHIQRLRRQLGHFAIGSIETIFGVGYRFQP
jgi:DNA-binding response OmpR family regulator